MALTRVRAENILDSDFKNSCRATSFTNITLSGGAPNTLDGVTLAANDRILVQGQTITNQNGIYYVSTLGSGSNGTWTRAQDAAQPYSITTGLLVYVNEGTNYGQRFYYVTTIGNIIVGTSNITFANLGSNFSNVTATNITANTAIYSNAYYYGNGLAFGGGGSSIYSNSNVAAYLPTYSGNISAGNITVNGNLFVTGNITTQNYETITQTEYANSIIASGNITAQTANVYASNVVANTGLYGYIATNAQTNITSVGTLSALTVSGTTNLQGTVNAGGTINAATLLATSIGNSASSITGTLQTAAQTNITSVGTLGSLTVTGAVNANTFNGIAVYAGTIGNTGATLTGTLSTATQTNITSVGTLGSLAVTGAVSANTFNGVAVYAGTIGNSGSTLTGTLSTASQTNITSVGTLTSLNSTGTIAAPTVIAGTIGNAGAVLYGTLNSQSASQTNITSTGALTSPSFTTSNGGQVTGYLTGAIGANTANTGTFTTITATTAIHGTISSGSIVGYLNGALGANTPNTVVATSVTTSSGGQITGYHTGAIGANTPNSGVFTTASTSGNLTVGGNLNLTGNVVNITSNVYSQGGIFYGTIPTGFNALYAGQSTFTPLAQTVVQVSDNYNNFAQINHQNSNSGSAASTDYVATADNGTQNDGYIDLGINSSTFAQGTLDRANDGFLYMAGNTTTLGGNLIIGTLAANDIVFGLAGSSPANEFARMRANTNSFVISSTTATTSTSTGALQVRGGVGVAGAVYANNFNGVSLYAGTIGNIGAALVGTLSTNAQPYVTSVGTLTSLTASGNITAQTANAYASYIVANSGLSGTLITNAQPYVTSVGTLNGVVSSGNITAQTANVYAANLVGNTGIYGAQYYWSNGNVFSSGSGGVTLTTSNTAPSSPTAGAQWYQGNTDILYEYIKDATGASYWVDISTRSLISNSVTAGAFTTLSASGNTSLNNYANIYIANGSTSTTSALTIVGNVYGQGGSGYLDFLKLQNTYSAATNPNKFFRVNSTGGIEIVNSAYTNTIFQMQDSGDTTIAGNLTVSGSAGITMPNRPAFRVSGNGASIASTVTVSGGYFVVDYNQGGYLNTSTGYFTAPVAGLYQVNIVVRASANNVPSAQIIVRKTTAIGSVTTSQIMIEYASNTTMNHTGGSTIVKMAVNDTLRFDVTVGTITFDGNDNWSVAYIG